MPKRLTLVIVAGSLLAAAAPAQDPYGSGSPGAGGFVPTLTSNQAWLGNGAFALQVGSGVGGGTAYVGASINYGFLPAGPVNILIGIQPVELLFIVPLALSGPAGTPGAGAASLPLPLNLPPAAALAGLTFYAQAVIDEAPFGTVSASAGLRVELVMPPLVFVGTSVGGSTDPTYFVDPLTRTLAWQFASNADNVTDAEFGHAGRRLYVGTGLGFQVQEVNLDVQPPVWSTLFAAGGSVYGIGVDHERDRIYGLVGSNAASRELVALDGALGSPTYGQPLATTTGLGGVGGYVERWEISPDGTRAAVLTVFSPQLVLVDTDPQSPGYMTWNLVGTIPTGGSPLPIAVTPRFTPDNREILVSVALGQAGEIARYDLALGLWIDHNPSLSGVQNVGPSSQPPAAVPAQVWELDLSRSARFAVVSGWSQSGGIGRLDFDAANPAVWSYTAWSPPVSMVGAWACAIAGDDSQVAVATFGAASLLHFLDAATGNLLGSTPLPGASNIYTVQWH